MAKKTKSACRCVRIKSGPRKGKTQCFRHTSKGIRGCKKR